MAHVIVHFSISFVCVNFSAIARAFPSGRGAPAPGMLGGTIFKVGGADFGSQNAPIKAILRRRGLSEEDVLPSGVGAFWKM